MAVGFRFITLFGGDLSILRSLSLFHLQLFQQQQTALHNSIECKIIYQSILQFQIILLMLHNLVNFHIVNNKTYIDTYTAGYSIIS